MSRTMVAVHAETDLGLKRQENEDSHAVWVPEDPAELERRGVLLLVADGMGGCRAGEVASRMTADTVLRGYRDGPGVDPLADLRQAVESANRAVHAESVAHPDLGGMGTTCTALVVRGGEAYLAHVGDSRAYLVRDGRLRQLTQDHSLVAQLLERRQITEEEARSDPRRNVITRSIGVAAEVEVDAQRLDAELREGDTLLLCSDGLHGQVTERDLVEAASARDLAAGCRQLIALANKRGGPDNITVVLARIVSASDPRAMEYAPRAGAEYSAPARRHSSRRTMMWLTLAILILVLLIVAIVWMIGRLGREANVLERTSASAASGDMA